MKLRPTPVAIALLVFAASCGTPPPPPPVADTHCNPPADPKAPKFVSSHEVPIIIEDGSILIRAYRSHFDASILGRIFPPPEAKAEPPAAQSTTPARIGSWHTHDGVHLLQVAVGFPDPGGSGKAPAPLVHQFALLNTDLVELQLADGSSPVDPVWFSKEDDPLLNSPCHGAGATGKQRTAWVMRGTGVAKKPAKFIADTAEYVNLEYTSGANAAALRLAGVRVWDGTKTVNKASLVLGSGCSSLQICPNDANGVAKCLVLNRPCNAEAKPGGGGNVQ